MQRHTDLVALQRRDENERDAEARERTLKELDNARANLRRCRVQCAELRADADLVRRFVVPLVHEMAQAIADQPFDVLAFLKRKHRDLPDDARFAQHATRHAAAEIMRRDPGRAIEVRGTELVATAATAERRPRPPEDVFVALDRAEHLVRLIESSLLPAEESLQRIERRHAMREFVRGFANRYLLQDAFYAFLAAGMQGEETELDAVRELRERLPKAAVEMVQMTQEQYDAVSECILRHSKDRLAIDFPGWDCNVIADRVVCRKKKPEPESGCALQ